MSGCWKTWFISSHGWFYWLAFLSDCMALHFTDRDLDGHLLNGSGVEWVTQLCWMTSEIPPGIKGFAGKRSGAGGACGIYCRTAGEVLELVEVVATQRCDCTKCHWVVHFNMVPSVLREFHVRKSLKSTFLTLPNSPPPCLVFKSY